MKHERKTLKKLITYLFREKLKTMLEQNGWKDKVVVICALKKRENNLTYMNCLTQNL